MRPAAWLHLTYRVDHAADDHRSLQHYTPLKPIFFGDNERPGRRNVYHRVTLCAQLCAQY